MAKNTKQDKKKEILALYMDHFLENGKEPESIYRFCKDHELEEKDFYQHFGNFGAIQAVFWQMIVEETLVIILKDKQFINSSIENQILVFYYTLFENFLLNRSYILKVLPGNQISDLKQLSYLRKPVQDFFKSLPEEERHNRLNVLPDEVKERSFLELNWLQFLSILRFWLSDSSPGFEKTDALIEKTVRATSDLKNFPPLDSIIDLGKFLYSERHNMV